MNGVTLLYLGGTDKKSGEGWTASVFNLGVPAQVTVFAYCLEQ